jgi:hypothetical protein
MEHPFGRQEQAENAVVPIDPLDTSLYFVMQSTCCEQATEDNVMDAKTARETLRYADGARRRARRDVGIAWFPLALFGTLTLASIAVARPASSAQTYWLIAGPLGGVAVAVYAYRRRSALGIEGRALWYVVTAAALMVAALGSAWLAGPIGLPWLVRFGPPLVVAAGYIAFAWIERNLVVAIVAAGLLVVTGAMALLKLSSADAGIALTLLYGVAFVATGLALRFAWRTAA